MFGFRNFHGRIVCKIRKANDIRQPWHLKMKGSHHEADESLSRGGGTQIGTYSSYCDHRTLGCAIGVGGVPQKSAESRPGNFRKVLDS
jgi:hypothetical protein